MTTIRPFKYDDLFKLWRCNQDPYVETYDLHYYTNYLDKWPDMCWVIESPDGGIDGYVLGKVEASPQGTMPGSENHLPWHGHVTALTVASGARRQGYASMLTKRLEEQTERQNGWFVDLYVRKSNEAAIRMYKKLGVVGYYTDDTSGGDNAEDAFDMRKPLKRDEKKQYVREKGEDYRVNPEDVW